MDQLRYGYSGNRIPINYKTVAWLAHFIRAIQRILVFIAITASTFKSYGSIFDKFITRTQERNHNKVTYRMLKDKVDMYEAFDMDRAVCTDSAGKQTTQLRNILQILFDCYELSVDIMYLLSVS